MPGRMIAIGDIHGCAAAFNGLLTLIEPAADDTLIVLGDCIDRGPDSRGVIDRMIELEDQCTVVPILGNHEEMLLAAVDRPNTTEPWRHVGGQQTLESYNIAEAQQLPRDHLLYLRTWGDYWSTSSYFFAHGNYDPKMPLRKQEWGYQRWQSLRERLPDPHKSGKTAVVGHTAQKKGDVLDLDYLVCIDTYCCGGKYLTAYDTTNNRFHQVDPRGNPR
ncbi:metallophosphoesterase [Aeoliella mucimassa]|uniref:Diadenosine tetraphosphatase n=1 Tax=Aeoliella mucimassa TaxID=2527972 RepID=A0A518ANP9_9BACT|nr:metallophosphoesterase [Aeoliella mucimassa]QDU56355.1 diadenosine tetraphosphatase [Aeoliella mucimassa]